MPLFSRQYTRELKADRDFAPRLKQDLRAALRDVLRRYNHHYRSPEGGSVLGDLPELFTRETGKALGAYVEQDDFQPVDDAQVAIACGGRRTDVLDLIQLFVRQLHTIDADRARKACAEVNDALAADGYPWRLDGDGYRRAESPILEQQADQALDVLAVTGFDGPRAEYAQARAKLTDGDTKGAIQAACNAFESTMKAIVGAEKGSARQLTRALADEGFFDDLPEQNHRGFPDNVLMALPFIGNRNGRHGQGPEVVDVPEPYAELAVTLAGAFITFCVAKTGDDEIRDASA